MRPDFSVTHSPRLTKRKGVETRIAPPMTATRTLQRSRLIGRCLPRAGPSGQGVRPGSPTGGWTGTGSPGGRAWSRPAGPCAAARGRPPPRCRRRGPPSARWRAGSAARGTRPGCRYSRIRDQRGVGRPLHGRHVDHPRDTRRRTPGQREGDDQPADRQALHGGGARIAPRDARGEAERRAPDHEGARQAGEDADDEAPVDVDPRQGADAELGRDRRGGGLVEARRVAQRPFHDVVEERDGDVAQEQRGDGLVDPATVAQPAGKADPEPAGERARQRHSREARHGRDAGERRAGRRGSQPAEHEGPFAADDDEPELRRQRHAERGEEEGRRALQRVGDGEGRAEAAAPDEAREFGRRVSLQAEEQREGGEACEDREDRQEDGLDPPAGGVREPAHGRGQGGGEIEAHGCRSARLRPSSRRRPRRGSPSSRARSRFRDSSGRPRRPGCPCCPSAVP